MSNVIDFTACLAKAPPRERGVTLFGQVIAFPCAPVEDASRFYIDDDIYEDHGRGEF